MTIEAKLEMEIKNIGATDFELAPSVEENKLLSEWYGGYVAEFKFEGHDFDIIAEGDVVANLYKNDEVLVYVKDKINAGNFNEEMSNHISDDDKLRKFMTKHEDEAPKGKHLELINSNWFSLETTHPDVEDTSLESGKLDDAILEVIDLIKGCKK